VSRRLFNVTYEYVDEYEASTGDTNRRGFLRKNVTLRTALKLLAETLFSVQSTELCSWITVCGQSWQDIRMGGRRHNVRAGDSIANSLHPAKGTLSDASWRRILNLINS